MSGPLPVEFEVAVYQVTARGNARQVIYRDDRDRQHFLENLKEACGFWEDEARAVWEGAAQERSVAAGETGKKGGHRDSSGSCRGGYC
jgi:hypothetical protein